MRILINRTDAIGDILLTLPMVELIKISYPQAKITILISERCKDLFIGHPSIDKVSLYKHQHSLWKRVKFSWQLVSQDDYDYYFHVGGAHIPSFITWLKRVPIRGGVLAKVWEFLFLNRGIRQKRSKVEMHEAEYNISLLDIAELSIPYDKSLREKHFLKIYLQQQEIDQAKEQLDLQLQRAGMPTNQKLLFVHPGMSGHTLNWPSEKYASYISEMEKNYPGEFLYLISYTPSDDKYLTPLRGQIENDPSLQGKVFYFDGSIKGLRNYMATLASASLFLGPSTGTTHIANALGVKVLAIFSPIRVQSAKRWGPFNLSTAKVGLVVPEVECQQGFSCDKDDCCHDDCMNGIAVEQVITEAKRLLNIDNDKEEV